MGPRKRKNAAANSEERETRFSRRLRGKKEEDPTENSASESPSPPKKPKKGRLSFR